MPMIVCRPQLFLTTRRSLFPKWASSHLIPSVQQHARRGYSVQVQPTQEAGKGQSIAATDDELLEILRQFHAPVRFAAAYGSGVFAQRGYAAKEASSKQELPTVDFIFGVTHPHHWHSLNMRQHRDHYSGLAYLGSNVVSKVQERIGAGVYFNPDVEVAGRKVKYGVVSMDRLIRDLAEWESLYIAGRFQKPTKVLREDARVTVANRRNLRTAVRTALLLLPQQFTEEDLFFTIAGLSYRGDFRMQYGENPHKIYNIVYTQMDAFRALYKPIIEDLPNVNYFEETRIEQDWDVRLRAALLQKLPKGLYDKVQSKHRWNLFKDQKLQKFELQEPELSQSVAESPQLTQYVEKSIAETVKWPAISQSLKGILTAGLSRSLVYVKRKLLKSRLARKQPPQLPK
ncbi:mitochondrial matrix Mmp37 [Phlyctochytrium arcticum]|nr:mitochondrial matrix Mmp37 [Phlyctochytrium arcticum]